MTEITLTHGDARATIALLGAEARQWRIAGRELLWPGDPAIWSDISPILYPVVGWTRERGGAGRRRPLSACPARLRPVRDLRRRNGQARLRPADAQRQCAHARGLSVRLCACDRIPAERRRARDRDRSRQSRREARALRLRAAPGFSLAASATRGAPARWFSSKGRSGPRFRNSRRAGSSADDASDSPLRPQSAAVRRPVRPRRALLPRLREPVARFHRRLRRVDHDGVRELSSTRRCGRGPTRRSFASRPGPATAIRTGLPAICSTSPACACWSRESRRATKRASSSGRSRGRGHVCARTIHDRRFRLRARRRGDRRRSARSGRRGGARAHRAWRDAGSRGRPRRRKPGEPDLCRRQGQGGEGVRLPFDPAQSASRHERSGVAGAGRGAQRRSGRAWHPRAIAAARGHQFDACAGSDRAR